jgi:Domain of unknown function (DUF4747)
MPRKATYKIAALNISIHPHNPDLYVKLFQSAFNIRHPVKIQGETHGVVHTMFDVVDGDPEKGIHGNLIKYTAINPKDPWYDVQKGKEATKEQLEDLSIPTGLAPNMKWTRYFFDPKHHKLIWVSYAPETSFSPITVWKIFLDFFQRAEIVSKYGVPEITIEQDRDRLEKIFKMYRLQCLAIEYTRPNPDDDDDEKAEKAVEEKLRSQKIQKVETIYKAEQNEGIVPDKSTKALARLALSNGHVEAKGRDEDGKKVEENTEKHPWSETIKEEPQKMNLAVWLPRIVADVIQRLSK